MFTRFRRKRLNPVLRDLLQETHLSVNDFIYPLFIKSGEGIKKEVDSMPGVYQMSIDEILKECEVLKKLGIYSILLFGIPEVKDSVGSDAMCEHGIIASSIRAIKDAHPDMFVVTDLCFCEYTDHGHCGVLDPVLETVDNDITLGNLAKQAVIHAKAGADILMVKPALAYLDIVRDIKENSSLPLAVYNVSGEYSMLKMAGEAGVIDYDKVMMETMIGFKRAGADIIISYHAKEVAILLGK